MAYKIQLYPERWESIKDLSLEDKWKILENIFIYDQNLSIPHDSYIEVIFNFMKNRIDHDKKEYENRQNAWKNTGILGWRPNKDWDNSQKGNERQKKVKKPISISISTSISKSKSNTLSSESEIDTSKQFSTDPVKEQDRFQEFRDLYDKKIDRWAVEKKRKKLKPKDIEDIFIHIPKYKQETPDRQFRKNPETYINNKSWENEIITWWIDYTNLNNFHDMMMQEKVPELKYILWKDQYFEIKKQRKDSPLYLLF